MHAPHRPIAAIVVFGLVFGLAPAARSADHELVTSVAAIYEYNDNIRLEADDPLADNIYTVAPKLELVRRHEKYTARADGKLEFYRYQDNDEFDDMDQWYNGFIEAAPTERWQLGAEVHFSEDNRPDRDIQETGLVLSNIQRRVSNVGTSAFYTFTEKMSGGLILEFNRENFDDPEVSDRKDYHAILAVNRNIDDWLARTTGRIHLGYSHYEFEREFDRTGSQGFLDVTTMVGDGLDVDYYSLTAGTESALTERLDLMVDLGGRYSRSEENVSVARTYDPPLIVEAPTASQETYDSTGFVGKVNLVYRGERSRGDLLVSHDLAPVSGDNATVNRTTVRLGGSMRLLERLSGNLFLQWYRNEGDQDDPTQDDVDYQTWNAGGGLRWALNDYLDLRASYVYTVLDNREAETTAYRNRALVTLEAHHDWLE